MGYLQCLWVRMRARACMCVYNHACVISLHISLGLRKSEHTELIIFNVLNIL